MKLVELGNLPFTTAIVFIQRSSRKGSILWRVRTRIVCTSISPWSTSLANPSHLDGTVPQDVEQFSPMRCEWSARSRLIYAPDTGETAQSSQRWREDE